MDCCNITNGNISTIFHTKGNELFLMKVDLIIITNCTLAYF